VNTIADVVVYATVATTWTFILLYQVISKGNWRKTEMGVHVMTYVAADALIFTMLGMANLIPWLAAQQWFLWTYIGAVSMIALSTMWRISILWRSRRTN
jgi:hypothetical protein